MSKSLRSLQCIVETGDAKALSAMLVGQVDINMVNGVSMQFNLNPIKDQARQWRRLYTAQYIMRPFYNQYCLCIHQNGLTALILAAQEGHHECLSILLAHGADVNKDIMK